MIRAKELIDITMKNVQYCYLTSFLHKLIRYGLLIKLIMTSHDYEISMILLKCMYNVVHTVVNIRVAKVVGDHEDLLTH